MKHRQEGKERNKTTQAIEKLFTVHANAKDSNCEAFALQGNAKNILYDKKA